MDDFDKSVQKDGEDVGIRVMHISEVVIEGKKHSNMDLTPFRPNEDDVYMFCYTSGTTGDPKAAMLTHKNIMSAACSVFNVPGIHFNDEDVYISYLPLAHSFEKCLFVTACTTGMAIGYFSGDPLKLLDDLK